MASFLLQVLGSFVGVPVDLGLNATTPPAITTTPSPTASTMSMPNSLPALITFLVSFSALRDWLKLIVIGGILETCRRITFSCWSTIVESFWITASFEEDDSSYDWVMVWLSKHPSWSKARHLQVSTREFGLNSSGAVMVPGEEEDPANAINGSRKLAYLPSLSTTYSIWYKRHWMKITRLQTQTGYYGKTEDTLQISILARRHDILNSLLLDAKKSYMAAQQHNISIYISDTSNNWRHVAFRPKRPLRSIVLDPGIKDLLIDDARDFLESKSWYSERGIPFRRGYLLYGAPGSGKTSIIHSMAGELGLDVYIISLSRAGLDDTALSELISELPEKCIALMEDIDAAFHHGLNRDLPGPKGTGDNSAPNSQSKPPPPTSRITLSGLLNALDGVGAQEGRILYATTNKYTSLDPALCRPGRMDLHVEFKLASQYQAGELYKCFYMPTGEVEKADKDIDKDKDHVDEKAENESVDSGYGSVRGETDDTPSATVSPSTTPLLSPTPIPALSPIPSSSPSAVPSPTLTPPPYQTVWMGSSHRARAPVLGVAQVTSLAAKFATMIPEREFSMASLQGYLMMYKTRPFDAVRDASGWVEKERKERIEKAKADVKEVNPEAAKVDPAPAPAVIVAEAAKVDATPPVVALKVADAPAEPAKDVLATVPATTVPAP